MADNSCNNWRAGEGDEWNRDSTIKPSVQCEFSMVLKIWTNLPPQRPILHIFLNSVCVCAWAHSFS